MSVCVGIAVIWEEEMLSLGECVLYGGEEGIVVHTDPCIMQTTAFHSYVPVFEPDAVSQGTFESSVRAIPAGVLLRIKEYLRVHNPWDLLDPQTLHEPVEKKEAHVNHVDGASPPPEPAREE